jgi:hypothetical protein
MLLWAFLAGPGLAAYAAAAPAGYDHAAMQASAGGCSGDGGMTAGICTIHCGGALTISAAIAPVPAIASTPLPHSRPALSAARRAGPPETAPPKG